MKVPAAKVEKCASKDQTRPVLASVYLRVVAPAVEEFGADDVATGAFEPGSGFLEATDSYKLVRVPVELEPGDVEGFIPPESLVAARKANRLNPRLSANGTIDVAGGASYPRPDLGQFPRTDSLIPENVWAPAGQVFEIGLNAKLLFELSQGLGSEGVRISFTAYSDETVSGPEPNPLRPMTVRPLTGSGRGRDSDPDAVGILMPIRVSTVDVVGGPF